MQEIRLLKRRIKTLLRRALRGTRQLKITLEKTPETKVAIDFLLKMTDSKKIFMPDIRYILLQNFSRYGLWDYAGANIITITLGKKCKKHLLARNMWHLAKSIEVVN